MKKYLKVDSHFIKVDAILEDKKVTQLVTRIYKDYRERMKMEMKRIYNNPYGKLRRDARGRFITPKFKSSPEGFYLKVEIEEI